jgi:hypothetical protein
MSVIDVARIHEVPFSAQETGDFLARDWRHMPEHSPVLQMMTQRKKPQWRRGDVLVVSGPGITRDRNDWVAMWDGKRAVALDSDIDDYGHVSKKFPVGREFHALHWMDAQGPLLSHNRLVPVKFTPTIAAKINAFLRNEAKAAVKRLGPNGTSGPPYPTFVFKFDCSKWAVVANFYERGSAEHLINTEMLDKKGFGHLHFPEVPPSQSGRPGKIKTRHVEASNPELFRPAIQQGVPVEHVLMGTWL